MNDWQNRSISKTLDEKTIKYVIDKINDHMRHNPTEFVYNYGWWQSLKEELLNETGD